MDWLRSTIELNQTYLLDIDFILQNKSINAVFTAFIAQL